uniref:TSPO associated protein 1 n=1 Tax=Pelusios castaneus TaxID=367368 RepID=A0A8C8RFM1_9SAUR
MELGKYRCCVELLRSGLERARVRELEDQCRSHIEQFSLLSQELGRFQLQRGRTDPLTSTLVTSDLPLVPCLLFSQVGISTPWDQRIYGHGFPPHTSGQDLEDPVVKTYRKVLKATPCAGFSRRLSFSYNPFDGPNETPEAELPLTAGEYIYVYGDMDEDGFFEGELMDGRRGLVPSNFVERVSDDDLMTFLLPEGNDLSQSSYHERSSAGASTGSREKSNHSGEEASVSPSSSRLDEEEPVNHTAVPYPRKPTLLKQLSSSIIIGWEPPLLPAGCTDVQSYNVYVDAELRQNVRSGAQTQAAIEELDVARKAYRVSVQSVTEKGSSDKLRCTLCVGKDVCSAPTLLNVRNLAATSAELTWLPSNSSYAHAVYLNEEERDTAKPGVYWHSLRDLHPGTQYVAKVVARLPDGLWELPQEQKPAVIHFTTPLAGTPEAPLDVQAEPGPSAGILLISWLPVTIDAEGSSNGVRVTGYAVYADGQKVMEVTSPTAGSVLVEVSQLQVFQVCREVSVRTMSLYGESVDSVPAQIPSALRKASRHSSQTQAALSSKPLRGSLPKRAPVTHCAAPLFPPQNYSADNSDAKCMVRTPPQHDSSVHCLPGTVSPHPHLSSPSASSVQALGTSAPGSESARHEPCLAVLPQPAGVGEEPAAASKGPAEEIQAQGTVSAWELCSEKCHEFQDAGEGRERKRTPFGGSCENLQGNHTAQFGAGSTWAVVLANVISLSAGPARSPAAEALVKDDPARVFVALFDYDPSSMSPNPDAAEEELPFKEGQILKVCGDKDADGFYRGECAGRAGYIPCNMVSEVRVESEEAREELLKQGFMPAAPPVESTCESAGDVITVFGSMDDDGFYYGELNRQRGLVPSNFLEAVSPDGGVTEGLHWREDIAGAVGAGNQVMWLGR